MENLIELRNQQAFEITELKKQVQELRREIENLSKNGHILSFIAGHLLKLPEYEIENVNNQLKIKMSQIAKARLAVNVINDDEHK